VIPWSSRARRQAFVRGWSEKRRTALVARFSQIEGIKALKEA